MDILDPEVDRLLLPTSFGYRRGLGVRDAVSAVVDTRDAGASFFLRADIRRCFESIPRTAALATLAEAYPDLDLLWLIRTLLERDPAGGSNGLYQGTALSPMLANLYLDRLDRQAMGRGLTIIRYGDDLAVPLFNRSDAPGALNVGREAAGALGLELNEAKLAVEDIAVGVHFLGETVTGSTETQVKSARPAKATVFVSGPNGLLRSRGDRLRVEIGGEDRLSVSLGRVRQIVCHGRVGVTTPLLHRVMGLGIDVIFLADSGRYIGRCAATGHIRAGRRRRQYAAAADPNVAMAVARAVIGGKLTNMRTGLVRWSRYRRTDRSLAVIAQIERARSSLASAGSVQEILGFDGSASAAYFSLFSELVGPEWEFNGRTRRPPRDRISSMLSFGYALLTMELIAACEIAGMDPYVGYLHAEGRGRPSLALDLVEEFRSVVVDSTVFRLVRTGAIVQEDFRIDDERGVLLTDAARRRFFDGYERRLLQTFSHSASGRRVSYRVALSLQAGLLAESLEHRTTYLPVVWK